MLVPEVVNWGSLSAGAVALQGTDFFIKTDDTSGTNLLTGQVASGFAPTSQVVSFPNASLNLG